MTILTQAPKCTISEFSLRRLNFFYFDPVRCLLECMMRIKELKELEQPKV